MERVIIHAEIREGTGKGVARKLRVLGKIPANVYSKDNAPLSVITDSREFVKLMHKHGDKVIIDLQVKKDEKILEKSVIIKELQYNSIKETVLHIDFHQIKMNEKIKISIPLVTKGDDECPGVKEGATLEHLMREIEIECLPTQIPHEIIVNVSALKINEAIYVKELSVPEGVSFLSDPEGMVVLVKFELQQEEKSEEEAEEKVSTEPEVIKQKKPEEGAA